jgi:hypothetical protein
MNISTFSTIELKAMAFDILAQQQHNQRNLELINQELAHRFNQPPAPTAENTSEVRPEDFQRNG